jgi:hypothetical protein
VVEHVPDRPDLDRRAELLVQLADERRGGPPGSILPPGNSQ